MKKILSLLLAFMLVLPCFSTVSISAAGGVTGQFIGAKLNISSSLTIDYYATLSQKDESVQARFTSSSVL